jgi:C_GCAxxG_C_C family probable redox protein
MSERVEKAKKMWASDYNCAQSLMIAFSDILGMSDEKAARLGAYYGGGMMHGSVCGTVSAALMILAAAGASREEAADFLTSFKARHGSTQCATLLRNAIKAGMTRNQHCSELIAEIAGELENRLKC